MHQWPPNAFAPLRLLVVARNTQRYTQLKEKCEAAFEETKFELVFKRGSRQAVRFYVHWCLTGLLLKANRTVLWECHQKIRGDVESI